MYRVLGRDREQARALKQAIDSHRPYGFTKAVTRVADAEMMRKLGVDRLPALVYLGNYPDESSDVHVVFQGSADPDRGQLEEIDAGMQAIADRVAALAPRTIPRERAVITGVVRDAASGEPIYMASVDYTHVKDDPRFASRGGARTDREGRFIVSTIAEGTVDLSVSMTGYQSWAQRLRGDGTGTDLDIHLEPQAGAVRARRQRGTFSGFIGLGPETRCFIPDGATVAAYFHDAGEFQCWFELAPGIAPFPNKLSCYRVRCEGVLHGPGSYGHMGMSSHSLLVEEFTDLAPASLEELFPGSKAH